MNAKRRAQYHPKKPIWQPEHWLILWESFWKRLPIVIFFSLLGVAEVIRAIDGETLSWRPIKELFSQVFGIR